MSSARSSNSKNLNRILLFGLVITLSCSIPSIISLLPEVEASPAAPVSELEASPFDFIKQQQPQHSTNGADSAAMVNFVSGTDRRSLPYSAAATNNQQQQQHQFDPSSYKNIYEAIRNHPDLREVSSSFSGPLLFVICKTYDDNMSSISIAHNFLSRRCPLNKVGGIMQLSWSSAPLMQLARRLEHTKQAGCCWRHSS